MDKVIASIQSFLALIALPVIGYVAWTSLSELKELNVSMINVNLSLVNIKDRIIELEYINHLPTQGNFNNGNTKDTDKGGT